LHLEHEPTLYNQIKNGLESVNNINYQKIHSAVLNGPGIEKTKELQSKHAMTELYKFPLSDARKALENIIMAMQEN
jgi:decaprenyl-diphosphate synthase subunit 2